MTIIEEVLERMTSDKSNDWTEEIAVLRAAIQPARPTTPKAPAGGWTVEHQRVGEESDDHGNTLYYGRFHVLDEDEQEVASVHGNTDAQADHRARLIAAAPALVEALQEMRHLAETPGDFTEQEQRDVYESARAALRLAGVEE